jgi:hypothetical protein
MKTATVNNQQEKGVCMKVNDFGLIQYRVRLGYDKGVDFLAVIKNGLVIDIACSKKWSHFWGPFWIVRDGARDLFSKKTRFVRSSKGLQQTAEIQVKAQDLALYTHWPQHTKEFWDLLNET